jgi:hypothetical protein
MNCTICDSDTDVIQPMCCREKNNICRDCIDMVNMCPFCRRQKDSLYCNPTKYPVVADDGWVSYCGIRGTIEQHSTTMYNGCVVDNNSHVYHMSVLIDDFKLLMTMLSGKEELKLSRINSRVIQCLNGNDCSWW